MDIEKIVKDFDPLIKSSIKKYFSNNTSFQDAYQDGVLKIIELLRTYVGGKVSLECYLKYQLKYFYMQKYFKQKKIKDNIFEEIEEKQKENLMENIKDNINIEDELIIVERNKIINKAILELSDKQKKVIYYRFFKGLKYREIAEIMSLKEDTVKCYYKNAKKKLKKRFEQEKISL